MEFLLEEGFSEELIEKMKQKYEDSTLSMLQLEQENALEVIHYFQKIGITRIEDLLLSYIEIFTKDVEEVKNAFLKHNVKEVVNAVNEDISVIDFI